MSAIQKKIRNPRTGKLVNEVWVKGKGRFSWNTAFNVYNSDEDFSQLQKSDRKNIRLFQDNG